MFEPTLANRYRRRVTMLGGACVMLIGLLVGATPQAHAAAIESFDSYTAPTTLNGKNGGGGWSGSWSAFFSSGFTEWNILSGGLDGSANRLQFERDASSRLPSSFEDERSAKRSIKFSPNSGSGPIYFGFYFQHDAALGADNSDNIFKIELRNSASRLLTFGILGDEVFAQTGTDATTFDRKVSALDLIGDGVTHQIIVKFEQDQGGPAEFGGGTGEKVSIFVDPASETEPGVADFVYTGGYSIAFAPGQTFNRVRLFGNYYNGQYASVDRLVLADNFATAFIPEPATALLLSLAAPMMLRRRTRA